MDQKNVALAPDFSEGVDRKQLKQVRNRFLALNQTRLERAVEAMPLRHADILEVLPLLYHVNHPLLPGFVSRQVPEGLSCYTPSKTALSVAKSFSQTFRFREDKRRSPAIMSLFMMGSCGTLAHSESSDIDLWCCHVPGLSEEQLAWLKQKADKIDKWANSLGLELHTFLMDAELFRNEKENQSVDSESSGSAQHYLLLDEFYRTAIWLSGRVPLWWLIPAYLEKDYEQNTQWLLKQRFIKEADIIDFGCVADIPKNELLGAGLWQLYKSLDAPYKSSLKLLLAEVYAQELPDQPCLSLSFKDAVYKGEAEADQLDSYYLIYKRLEHYLQQRKESKRLELVRKCFYVKVNKPLSRPPSNRRASWQRLLLQSMVDQWGWSNRLIKQLDQRRNWKVDQVLIERQELLSELTYSYRFLSNYARSHKIVSTITASDLTLLGRKLYATFQRKAGKIECVNPGIAPSLWEENLAIHHSSGQEFVSGNNLWFVYRDVSANEDASYHASLYKSSSLLEVIAWLYFNGILNVSTRLNINPGETGVSLDELRHLISALQRNLPMPLPSVSQDAYMDPARVTRLMLFVNLGVDPMEGLSHPGTLRLSDQSDSLVYSSQRHNLVRTIDQVALNSWNELSSRRYELGETLMQNLQSYLLMCREQVGQDACQLDVYCFSSARADAIAQRVKTLFEETRKHFFTAKGILPIRYIIEVEAHYYLIRWVDRQFRYMSYADERSLMTALTKYSSGGNGSEPAQDTYSPIVLDSGALKDQELLRLALARNHPGKVQVYYRPSPEGTEVVTTDEYGSVHLYHTAPINEELFVESFSVFLEGMRERRQLDHSFLRRDELVEHVISRVRIVEGKKPSIKAIRAKTLIEHYPVNVIVFYDGLDPRFDLSFEGQLFSHSDYGDRQVDALVDYISKLPDYERRRPILLKDIAYANDPMLMRSVFANEARILDILDIYYQITSQLAPSWSLS